MPPAPSHRWETDRAWVCDVCIQNQTCSLKFDFNFVTFPLGYFSVQLDTQDGTLLVDYSKNIITEETMKLLMNLVCQWNGYKDIRFLFFSVKEWALKKSSVVFLNWKSYKGVIFLATGKS